MIWEEKFDEVDTFEAFYKNVIFRNNVIVIPYVNSGVSYHPLNPSKEHLLINKVYVVCTDACINKVNGEVTNLCKNYNLSSSKKISLSGVDIDKNKHIELEILCQKVFLQTLPDSKMRKEFWIPINTPNLLSNLDQDDTEDFFNHVQMPENIKQLLSPASFQ